MSPHPSTARRLAAWLALLAWFAICLAISVSELDGAILGTGHPIARATALLLALPAALVPTVAMALAVRLSRRHPVMEGRIVRGLMLHVGAAIVLAAIGVAVRVVVRTTLLRVPLALAAGTDRSAFLGAVEGYLLVTALAHAVEYARRSREKQLVDARLEAELARAELERAAAELRMLKMQLNPRFLFGALHAVGRQIGDAPSAAQRMVVQLAELLREAMSSVATQEVALDEELAGLRRYAAVEELRLGDRLTVEWRVNDAALDAMVPHMLLQPFLEEAIRPADETPVVHARVEITAARDGEWLVLGIRGDAPAAASASDEGGATAAAELGRTNARARLSSLYGAEYELAVGVRDARGTATRLRLPWHEEPAPLRTLARESATGTGWRSVPLSPRGRVLETLVVLAFLAYRWAGGYATRYADAVAAGSATPGAVALLLSGANAALWAGALLGAMHLTRAHPLSRHEWKASLPRHAAAAVGLAAALLTTRMLGRLAMGNAVAAALPPQPADLVLWTMVDYALFAGLAHAIEYARRYRQQHIAQLRLEGAVARAELERTGSELRMLKMQLNPHFLFNALHAVTRLIPDQPADARAMIARLGELLRLAMHSVATDEVPLVEELAGLRPFLELEQLRLGAGLSVDWQVDDDTLDALVPHLLLQPLVENAIKHGLVPAGGRGRITVGARRDGSWLTLTVRDDGVGLATSAPPERAVGGVGSANVRARLAQLYGAEQRFTLQPAEGGGTLNVIRIPWRSATVACPAEQHATVT